MKVVLIFAENLLALEACRIYGVGAASGQPGASRLYNFAVKLREK
jgi:hypothetical protein